MSSPTFPAPAKEASILIGELRYAVRQIWKVPGFSLIVVLTLGIGIGANLAIFQLLHAVLFGRLPVAAPEQIYSLHAVKSPFDAQWFFSYSAYQRLNNEAAGTAPVLAHSGISEGLLKAPGYSGQHIRFQLVSANFFDVLGLSPQLGRFFYGADEKVGEEQVAVLRSGYWKQSFARDTNVVGKHVIVNGVPVTIVGVAPEKFFGVTAGSAPDVWLPLTAQTTGKFRTWFDSTGPGTGADIGGSYMSQANVYWLWLLARLPDAAKGSAVASRWTRILQPDLASLAAISKDARERTQVLDSRVQLISAAGGEGTLRENYSPALLILMAMAGVVFLVGCVNIANLQLARLLSRQHELSVRSSLGASRWQLLRHLLIEGLLLAVAGAILAVVIGRAASVILLHWASGSGPTIAVNLESGWAFFAFGGMMLMLALISFSVLPALRITRDSLAEHMTTRASSSSLGGPRTRRWSSILLAAQVSFSLLSLGTAALFAQTLLNLSHVNLGLDRDHVITVHLDFSTWSYSESALPRLYVRILERLKEIHGVHGAALQMCAIPGCMWHTALHVAGRPDVPERQMHGEENRVGAAYFHTMGIPLLEGREFGALDTTDSQRVVILSRAFARQLFGNDSPIGHRIGYGPAPHDAEYVVVAEVGDARVDDLRSTPPPVAYFSIEQRPAFVGTIMVRGDGEDGGLFAEIRQALLNGEPDLPVTAIIRLNAEYEEGLSREMLLARLTGAFGFLSLGLAALGIYGLLSFMVTRRTAEIGIRVAVGARPADLYRLVLRQTVQILVAGILPGLVLTQAMSFVARNLLYGASAMSFGPVLTAAGVLMAVGFAASLLPAFRATRIDPIHALRAD
jgi:predicted permease